MTDRFNSFLVVLEKDIREDDAESTLQAIKMIKGVMDVTPNIADYNESVAEMRVRNSLMIQIRNIFYPEVKGG